MNAHSNDFDAHAAKGAMLLELPVFHPERVLPRMRPLKAWKHFRLLIADKENTEEVFRIFEALPSRQRSTNAEAFVLSEAGRKLMQSEPDLPALLDDHETLRRLPENTVAHAYIEFMESQGLTAQGLTEEFARFEGGRKRLEDQFRWYLDRERDTHDLLHVLTGYSRDALGEQCVLAFTYGQSPGIGTLFVAYAGALHMRQTDAEGAPVLGAVREAHRNGRGRPRIAECSIRELLAMPLDEARHAMGIPDPAIYRQCHEHWRALGIDPFDLLAPQPKQAAA